MDELTDSPVRSIDAATVAEPVHIGNPGLKVSYHPNWRVTVDGQPVETFMVSPSFIGVTVPAGAHLVRAVYGSPWPKGVLLGLGTAALAATIWFRGRLDRLAARLL